MVVNQPLNIRPVGKRQFLFDGKVEERFHNSEDILVILPEAHASRRGEIEIEESIRLPSYEESGDLVAVPLRQLLEGECLQRCNLEGSLIGKGAGENSRGHDEG